MPSQTDHNGVARDQKMKDLSGAVKSDLKKIKQPKELSPEQRTKWSVSKKKVNAVQKFMSMQNGMVKPVRKSKKQPVSNVKITLQPSPKPTSPSKTTEIPGGGSRDVETVGVPSALDGVLREATNVSQTSGPGREPSLLSSIRSLKSHAKYLKQRATDVKPSRFTSPGEAKQLFRVASRKVLIVMSWMAVLSGKDDRIEGQLKTFLDIAQEIDDKSSEQSKRIEELTGVAFNVKDFRAKRDVHLPEDVVSILTLRSEHRTPEMIQRVLPSLQVIDAFADYPIHLQQKLAKVGWFQHVEAKKVILRQGHYAENFYFVIVGAAIAKQLVKDEHSGKASVITIARMTKGQSFGETDILENTERTCTVESLTHLETLVIGREDFLNIFINTVDGNEPEHITFCRQLPFLKGFPVENLIDDQDGCMMHYFRRGCVMVADNKHSEWIYIVQNGSCSILKKLRHVNPQKILGKRGGSTKAIRLMTSSEYRHDRQSLSRTRSAPDTLSRSSTSFIKLRIGDVTSRGDADDLQNSSHIQSVHTENNALQFHTRDTSTPLSPPSPVRHFETPPPGTLLPGEEHPSRPSSSQYQRSEPCSRPTSAQSQLEVDSQQDKHISVRMSSDSPIEHLFSGSTSRQSHHKAPTPCFVQLKLLRRGDVFGLEDVEFADDPENAIRPPTTAVQLVSNGAEVIMLSKEYYMRHADAQVRSYIKEHVRLFPQEVDLQSKLQNTVNWSSYRQDTLVAALSRRCHTFHTVGRQLHQDTGQISCL